MGYAIPFSERIDFDNDLPRSIHVGLRLQGNLPGIEPCNETAKDIRVFVLDDDTVSNNVALRRLARR